MEVHWDFPRMLYWYFKEHTISVSGGRFQRKLAKQIMCSGLDPLEFGFDAKGTALTQ
jgi:hypothetical protein